MKALKVLFLVLVAVGICGGLYFGLYAGMRLAGLTLARPELPAAAPAPRPATAPAREEDPREVLHRRLGDLGSGGVAPVASSSVPPPTAILPMPYRTWLPAAESPVAPRAVPGEAGRPLRAAPATDVPPLADAGILPPPTPVRLAAVVPAAVASPDPGQVPVNSIASRGPPGQGELADDPTAHESNRSVIAATPPLRQTPAPFLKLSIPDPSPVAGGPVLQNPPPDEDPPLTAPGLPARVTLAETKAAKR